MVEHLLSLLLGASVLIGMYLLWAQGFGAMFEEKLWYQRLGIFLAGWFAILSLFSVFVVVSYSLGFLLIGGLSWLR